MTGPVFVGRARELDQLAGLPADAAAGRPRIAVVEGEAGLGKSSLISEFLSRHRDVRVLAASGEVSEQASVALARGQPEQAEHILEASRTVADSLQVPLARALYDVEYGRCLARAHRRPAALARLRSAHEVLARLGARPFADAVAAELAALGLRGRPDADWGLAGLTAQELQVARLVGGGLSNREAAAQLYLSPKTIEYHLAHIFAKLGIRTRYQLAARVGPAAAAPVR